MIRRKLGRGGPEVSAVGIGGMSFSSFFGPVEEADCHAVLDAAVELGIDHIDTANVYGMGQSETIIGNWLRSRGTEGRERFCIATKASIKPGPDRSFDNSAEHLTSELDASLKRLGVERVDLFYIHRRDPSVEIEEVAQTLAGLVQSGKVAAVGFSEIAPGSLERAQAVLPVAAVQSEYSLQTRQPEIGMVQACERSGTALVAFSPVGRGLLTDTPPGERRVAASSFLSKNPRFMGGNLKRNLAASDALRRIAAEAGMPAAALAIGWVLSRSETVVAIPGTRSAAHLGELAMGGAGLSADLLARIDAAFPPGWAHGARYSDAQMVGPEHYC